MVYKGFTLFFMAISLQKNFIYFNFFGCAGSLLMCSGLSLAAVSQASIVVASLVQHRL